MDNAPVRAARAGHQAPTRTLSSMSHSVDSQAGFPRSEERTSHRDGGASLAGQASLSRRSATLPAPQSIVLGSAGLSQGGNIWPDSPDTEARTLTRCASKLLARQLTPPARTRSLRLRNVIAPTLSRSGSTANRGATRATPSHTGGGALSQLLLQCQRLLLGCSMGASHPPLHQYHPDLSVPPSAAPPLSTAGDSDGGGPPRRPRLASALRRRSSGCLAADGSSSGSPHRPPSQTDAGALDDPRASTSSETAFFQSSRVARPAAPAAGTAAAAGANEATLPGLPSPARPASAPLPPSPTTPPTPHSPSSPKTPQRQVSFCSSPAAAALAGGGAASWGRQSSMPSGSRIGGGGAHATAAAGASITLGRSGRSGDFHSPSAPLATLTSRPTSAAAGRGLLRRSSVSFRDDTVSASSGGGGGGGSGRLAPCRGAGGSGVIAAVPEESALADDLDIYDFAAAAAVVAATVDIPPPTAGRGARTLLPALSMSSSRRALLQRQATPLRLGGRRASTSSSDDTFVDRLQQSVKRVFRRAASTSDYHGGGGGGGGSSLLWTPGGAQEFLHGAVHRAPSRSSGKILARTLTPHARSQSLDGALTALILQSDCDADVLGGGGVDSEKPGSLPVAGWPSPQAARATWGTQVDSPAPSSSPDCSSPRAGGGQYSPSPSSSWSVSHRLSWVGGAAGGNRVAPSGAAPSWSVSGPVPLLSSPPWGPVAAAAAATAAAAPGNGGGGTAHHQQPTQHTFTHRCTNLRAPSETGTTSWREREEGGEGVGAGGSLRPGNPAGPWSPPGSPAGAQVSRFTVPAAFVGSGRQQPPQQGVGLPVSTTPSAPAATGAVTAGAAAAAGVSQAGHPADDVDTPGLGGRPRKRSWHAWVTLPTTSTGERVPTCEEEEEGEGEEDGQVGWERGRGVSVLAVADAVRCSPRREGGGADWAGQQRQASRAVPA